MDLIIKPTEVCNFSCTFCSSTGLTDNKSALLPISKISQFLDRFPETKTIIINGGDPLVLDPSYYWQIIEEVESRNLETTLSFTTNLWDFYKNPSKWEDLFNHPLVGIGTSFNYGDTRRINKNKVFTEEIFWKVSNLFLERIGYRPMFISVITEENYHLAMENVRLAKKMNTECKVNYALASGRLSKPFLKGKIYKFYLDVIDEGLEDYEYNTKQLIKKGISLNTTCPLNRDCDESIRCLQPDGDYYSCGAFGDDKEYPIDFELEMNSLEKIYALRSDVDIQMLKNECLACPLFNICNGCKKNISDLKRNEMVEEHCSAMKENLPRLKKVLFFNE